MPRILYILAANYDQKPLENSENLDFFSFKRVGTLLGQSFYLTLCYDRPVEQSVLLPCSYVKT